MIWACPFGSVRQLADASPRHNHSVSASGNELLVRLRAFRFPARMLGQACIPHAGILKHKGRLDLLTRFDINYPILCRWVNVK